MNRNTIFQGDTLFRDAGHLKTYVDRALRPDSGYSRSKPNNKGEIILHVGEGKDHAHVITGDVDVIPWDGDSVGVKQLVIKVKSGVAEVTHKNIKTGEKTGDHDTIKLATGIHVMNTQRMATSQNDITYITD